MNTSKNASIEFALSWQSKYAKHTDNYFINKVNFWRDILPGSLDEENKIQTFDAGELVPTYNTGNVCKIRESKFNKKFRGPIEIEPQIGRFYPKGMVASGVGGIFEKDMNPFRYLGRDGDLLIVDLNHPLAQYPLTVEMKSIEMLKASANEHGGRCNDIAEILTDNSVGLQASLADIDTNFFYGMPFGKMDGEQDSVFYTKPRLVNNIDSAAMKRITEIYSRFLKQGMKVLDLMSSWNSHLPEENLQVSGLGMNREELEKNDKLTEFSVHDLNLNPKIAYKNQEFDLVICTASIEYLTSPIEVFKEVARILKPGGNFVLTFSERWFPSKVTNIWTDIHPFERMGLVIEYFRKSEKYTNINTETIRGLPRSTDDKYYGKHVVSDPVYAVWASLSQN